MSRRRPARLPASFCLLLGAASVGVGCADTEPSPAPSGTRVSSHDGDRETRTAAFARSVESFTPGEGAGFGADQLPEVVLGPPEGGGAAAGSLDVLTLGRGGEIVLQMDRPVVDGVGADFIVFENAFQIAGSDKRYEELGEVSVSADGITWTSFPCDPPTGIVDRCAGRTPVLATSTNGVSLVDPAAAGGDAFDLAELGLARITHVRIRDKEAGAPGANGFDLDAVVSIHHEDR